MKNRFCFVGMAKQFFAVPLLLCLSIYTFSQTKVTGKVTGPDSKPLFGVTVSVKGTNVATTTSADGIYSVTLPSKANVLIFTSVGYEVAEVNVKGHNEIDVAMKLQTTRLNPRLS